MGLSPISPIAHMMLSPNALITRWNSCHLSRYVTVADDSEKRHNQSKSKTKLTARIRKKAGTVLLERDFGDLGARSKERDFWCCSLQLLRVQRWTPWTVTDLDLSLLQIKLYCCIGSNIWHHSVRNIVSFFKVNDRGINTLCEIQKFWKLSFNLLLALSTSLFPSRLHNMIISVIYYIVYLENRDYGRRGSAALTMRHRSIRKSWH
jgi:hypothetical protein